MTPIPSPIPSPPQEAREREDSRLDARDVRSDARSEVPEVFRPSGLQDDGRQRQRSGEAAINPYDVSDIKRMYAPTNGYGKNKEQVDKEVDFQWMNYETYGKPNYTHVRAHHDQGWRAVMHSDFPDRFAPAGTDGPVRVNDMIFMHRPMRLTVQARQEEYAKATRAMQVHRMRMGEAPEGQAPRTVPELRTSREAIEIPD